MILIGQEINEAHDIPISTLRIKEPITLRINEAIRILIFDLLSLTI